MKILAYSKSAGKSTEIQDAALLLLGRAPYPSKIFVPKSEKKKYTQAVADTNYHWYLVLNPEMVMTDFEPEQYAKGTYDLLLEVPDTIKINPAKIDEVVPSFCNGVSKARSSFSKNPKKMEYKLPRGVVMRRVIS